MRLIDADALRDRFQSLAYDDWNQGAGTTWANAFSESADIVEEQPTADVQEMTLENAIDYLHKVGWMQEHDRILTESAVVKHGKWNTFFSDSYKVREIGVECSCCGYRTQERTTYCPNCGADMRGEEDE